jgi:Cutinase/Putative Ig domain
MRSQRSRRMMLAGALAALMALTTSLANLQSARAAVSQFLSPGCPDVLVLGLRGSSEPPQPNGNPDTQDAMGRENWATYLGIKSAYDGRAVVAEKGVAYPADAILPDLFTAPVKYLDSVASGGESLAAAITSEVSACPQAALVVTGYSQGAWAVHQGLYATPQSARSHVAAILLFGDPEYSPADAFNRSALVLGGIGPAQVADPGASGLPADLIPFAASWCLPHDPVCQGAVAADVLPSCLLGQPACAHFRYIDRGITSAAARVATHLLDPVLKFTIDANVLPVGTVGWAYSTQLTALYGRPPITWTSLNRLPAGLALSTSGLLSGVPATAVSTTIRIRATDADGRKATTALGAVIEPTPPLLISTSSLASATMAEPYSALLSATGGVPPYSWTVSGLPDGLSADATGQISGIPLASGTATVSVAVTDHAGVSTSTSLSLTVLDQGGPSPLTIDTATLPDAVVGVPYATVISGHGGTPPLTWSLATTGSFPGLAFDIADPGITGTPTQYGQWFLAVNLDDAAGAAVQQSYYLRILSSSRPATVLPPLTLNQPYTGTLTPPDGGAAPFTWAMANGPGEFLQQGLSLDPATGTISGVPFVFFNQVASDSHFTVKATDSNGQQTIIDYSIPVAG